MSRLKGIIVMALLGSLLSGFAPGVAAQESTPTAAETAVSEETLFSWTVAADSLPGEEVESVFYRLTLPAGLSLPMLAGPFCG